MPTITLPKDCRARMFYVIPMPLNSGGQGPASIEDATSITYEVWDQVLVSHASFDFLPDAINDAETRNELYHVSSI